MKTFKSTTVRVISGLALTASLWTGARQSLCIRADGADLRPIDHHCHAADVRAHAHDSHDGCGHCDDDASTMTHSHTECCFDLPADTATARVLPSSFAREVALLLHGALAPTPFAALLPENSGAVLPCTGFATGPPHIVTCVHTVVLRV